MPTSQVVTLNTMAEFHCETPTGIHPSFRVNNQSPTRVPLPGVTLCNSTEASTIKIIIQATSNYNNSIISCVYVVDPELHILCCSDPEAILTITDSDGEIYNYVIYHKITMIACIGLCESKQSYVHCNFIIGIFMYM